MMSATRSHRDASLAAADEGADSGATAAPANASASSALNVEDALNYLKQVKAALSSEPHAYNSFLDALKAFKDKVRAAPRSPPRLWATNTPSLPRSGARYASRG